MAARRRIRIDASEPAAGPLRKRTPRPGRRRGVHVALLAEHALWLDVRAARSLTTPAEVVMDLIDGARRRNPGDAAALDDAA